MQQKRLVIALLVSTAILFLWSYLVPVKPPEQPPASPSPQASQQQTATPANTAVATPTPAPVGSPSPSVIAAPHRTISIKTPLYDAKLDTHGAEAISWIIKKNKESRKPVYQLR